jgi:hypothetical protein
MRGIHAMQFTNYVFEFLKVCHETALMR